MNTSTPLAQMSQKELRAIARAVQFDNHGPGDPGYCPAQAAHWTVEAVLPEQLENAFSTPDAARAWLASEIEMDRDEQLHRDWAQLLVEHIRDEPVVLLRDGQAYIWDGWHRTAALLATARPVFALVGRPL